MNFELLGSPGWREGLIAIIALLVLYLVLAFLRIRRLKREPVVDEALTPLSTHPLAAYASEQTAPISDPPSPSNSPAPAASPAAQGAPNQLSVRFHGTSWIEVRDRSGSIVLSMTGNDGTSREIAIASPGEILSLIHI